MSFADLLTARENEILRILDAIYPEKNRFTVVGGYAVDAYSALPRYSVDCDVVISASDLSTFENLFAANGFVDGGSVYRMNPTAWKRRNLQNPSVKKKYQSIFQ